MPLRRSAHCGRTAVGGGWWTGYETAAGARKMLFFLQRDSHSAGCTRQTPPNRVSADSPSRILPGDVLVSLRSPPPKELQRCEWPSGNFHSSEVFLGPIKKKLKGAGPLACKGYSTPHIKFPFCHKGYFLVLFGAPA